MLTVDCSTPCVGATSVHVAGEVEGEFDPEIPIARTTVYATTVCTQGLLFVSHLRPMGLNVLGYHSHILQYFILSVVTNDLPISPWFSPYEVLSRCKFSTLYNSSTDG